MHTGLSAVMTSIPERKEFREVALQSLFVAGISDVHVVEQNDPARGGDAYFRTIYRALTICPPSHWLLYVEDDIMVAPWFRVALDAAVEANHPVTTFYLSRSRSFYPSGVLRAIDSDTLLHGLYPIRNSRHWYGSQALLFTADAKNLLVDRWRDGYIDNQIRRLFSHLFVYLPNPVKHMGARRTWGGGKPHTSLTYREEL